MTQPTTDRTTRVIKLRDEHTGRLLSEVPVSEDVYRAYYQEYEHARYLEKKARASELSWQRLEEDEGMPVDARLAPNLGLDDAQKTALHRAMATLDPAMQEALWRLACGETTVLALAEEWGVSKSAAYRKRDRALAALKAQLAPLYG